MTTETRAEKFHKSIGARVEALRNYLPPNKHLCIQRKGDVVRIMTFHWKRDEWEEIGRGVNLVTALGDAQAKILGSG